MFKHKLDVRSLTIKSEDRISPTSFLKKNLLDKIISKLHLLESHHGLFILKNCVYAPKLLYILRTRPCFSFPDILRNTDDSLRISFEKLLNVQMTDTTWIQTTLPCNPGGLGIRLIPELALAAFLASAHAVCSLVSEICPSEDLVGLLTDPVDSWITSLMAELSSVNFVESRNFGIHRWSRRKLMTCLHAFQIQLVT